MQVVTVTSLDAPACSNTDELGGFVKRVKPTCAAHAGEIQLSSPAVETPGSWCGKAACIPLQSRGKDRLLRTAPLLWGCLLETHPCAPFFLFTSAVQSANIQKK